MGVEQLEQRPGEGGGCVAGDDPRVMQGDEVREIGQRETPVQERRIVGFQPVALSTSSGAGPLRMSASAPR